MNAEQAGLVFWGVGISFACGVVLCYCLESKDDQEDNDQPRPTFQELIRTLKFPEENNPSRLGSIPTVHFNSLGSKGCLECVVCLSDFAHGEEAKVLPKCDHWFHVKCIDTWFESHSTCPICRNIVGLTRDLQPPPSMVANLEVMIDIPVGA